MGLLSRVGHDGYLAASALPMNLSTIKTNQSPLVIQEIRVGVICVIGTAQTQMLSGLTKYISHIKAYSQNSWGWEGFPPGSRPSEWSSTAGTHQEVPGVVLGTYFLKKKKQVPK
jgi:hypothetical protein